MTCNLLSVRRRGRGEEGKRERERERERDGGGRGGIKKERGRITQYLRGTCTYNIKDSHLLVSTIIVHWYSFITGKCLK